MYITRPQKIIAIMLAVSVGLLVALDLAALLLAPGRILTHTIPIQQAKGPYGGMGVYAINLDRAPRRWALLEPQIQALHLPYARVAAVDYRQLSPDTIDKMTDLTGREGRRFFEKRPPNLTEVACQMSHIKAWQAFLNSRQMYALILEDDAKFNPVQLKNALTRVQQVPHLWDKIKLNYERPEHKFRKGLTVTSWPKQHMQLILFPSTIGDAAGYIINRYAARQMLRRSMPYTLPADIYNQRDWEFQTKQLMLYPRMVEQRKDVTHYREYTATEKPKTQPPQYSMRWRQGLFNIRNLHEMLMFRAKLYLRAYAHVDLEQPHS